MVLKNPKEYVVIENTHVRLRLEVKEKLRNMAKESGKTITQVIEELVLKA